MGWSSTWVEPGSSRESGARESMRIQTCAPSPTARTRVIRNLRGTTGWSESPVRFTWLLMGYFRTVPKEIEECAMLDGCNRLQTMLRILLPVAVPGVICSALFAFTLSWNEFLYSLVFVSPAELKTMTVGVFSELIRGDIYYWGGLMAGACIGSLPIVIAYVFFLDYYVSGLTAGAVK